MKKSCLIPLIILCVLAIGGAAYAIFTLYLDEVEGPATYKTQTASTATIIDKTVATGSVQPRKEVAIKPQISGIVKEIYVEAGEQIEVNDLIAKVKVIPNMVSLNNAENRVEQAKISLDNAIMDYERNAELMEKGVIAAADFQGFEIAQRQAQEELDAAKDALAIVKEGVSQRSGSSSLTLIKATIPGMVLDVPVKEGNSVIEANNFNDGTTIASIADMKDLLFIGKVDESEVEKLEIGMELILTIGAIEDRTFPATLEYIAPKGVEDNGAIKFEIKAAVNLNEGEFVRAGYSANADVVLRKRENVLAIDEALVQFDDEKKPFVEVEVSENIYEKRMVELGLSDGMKVEVLSGLSAEDKIKMWSAPIYDK
jgi:HlyD family secretion protein